MGWKSLFVFSLALGAVHGAIYSAQNVPPGELPPPLKNAIVNFNVIQVGGGAGGVSAALLAQSECLNVLVLEEGFNIPLNDPYFPTHPGAEYWPGGYYHPNLEKGGLLVPNDVINGERNARGSNHRKIFGGDEIMSHYAHEMGDSRVWRRDIYQALGNRTEWSPERVWNVTQRKLTKFRGTHLDAVPHYPLPKNNTVHVMESHSSPFLDDWLQSCSSVTGYRIEHDLNSLNGGFQTCGAEPSNLREDGFRSISQNEFLYPEAETNPYLTLIKDASVSRVIFKGTTAIGVEGNFRGIPFSIRLPARVSLSSRNKCPQNRVSQIKRYTKIILSAGAIENPKLLLLSGVGPSQQLAERGIKLVVNSPMVGKNYREGLVSYLGYATNGTMSDIGLSYDTNDWTTSRPASFAEVDGDKFLLLLTPSYYNGVSAFALVFDLEQPYTGEITLISSNPQQLPRVNYGWQPQMIAKHVKGLEYFRNILTQSGMMDRWGMYEYFPGPGVTLSDAVRIGAEPILHASGSTKMTTGNINTGVVNTNFEVIGTTNLLAGSMSVIPVFLGAGGQGPARVVAFNLQNSIRAAVGLPQL